MIHKTGDRNRLALMGTLFVLFMVFAGSPAQAQEDFVMRLDTVTVQPGQRAEIGLLLDNARPVTSFELLIHHDPIALSPLEVTVAGTRAGEFEYLEFEYDASGNPGNIRVLAIADILGQPATPPLAAGSGEICRFAWRVVPSTLYSGQAIPVRFEYLHSQANTLIDEFGEFVGQGEITYYNGWVFVDSIGEIRIGDINLNAVAADVGDAVLFTNYFMNPFQYPLDALQLANSDVNADGLLGTVADLVRLINWIVQGQAAARPLPQQQPEAVDLVLKKTGEVLHIDYESSTALGAALIIADLKSPVDPERAVLAPDGMEAVADTLDGKLRVLVYSLQGSSLKAGMGHLIGLDAAVDADRVEVELASSEGSMLSASIRNEGVAVVPSDFALHQNYPNPFNPSTTISFEITGSSAQRVRLAIYNALGQEVKILIDENLLPGTHQATWDGRNDHGHRVASGVYLYRLSGSDHSETRKMLLLK